MGFFYPCRRSFSRPTVFHQIVYRHQVEIEVYPAQAEVYFRDERYTDPVNTIWRFHANVYNAPYSRVIWSAQAVDGGPSAGSIDQTGLYLAPPKGNLSNGTTDIIVATAAVDPLRKAFATVTLVGLGPEKPVLERLEIFPKQAVLYYASDVPPTPKHNVFIDLSNKMQLFRATIYHTTETAVKWFVKNPGHAYEPAPGASTEPWYLYDVTGNGPDEWPVKVKAQLNDNVNVFDEAKIILINYRWPMP